MRKSSFLILASGMLWFSSCGSESKQTEATATDSVAVARNIQPHMQRSEATQETQLNEKKYIFHIVRKPDSELPEVKLPDGSSYTDNRINLVISQGDTEVFNHSFTKNDFTSVINTHFLENSILEGIVFDRIEKGKFLFAASVSYPLTDMYVPARLLITAQGSYTLEKEEHMDDTLNDSVW